MAPAAARYVLHVRKINFQMKRRTRPDTVFEKRESDQTTKLLVRVVLFSARSLPRAKKLNPREADKVKNAPRRGSSSPSCPASASTRAMIQHGPCPLARTNRPGHVPAAPARADGRKAWRAEVPAGEDEKEEGREAVAAVRDQLRLQSDSPVWGTSWFMRSTSTSSRRGCWRFRTTQLP